MQVLAPALMSHNLAVKIESQPERNASEVVDLPSNKKEQQDEKMMKKHDIHESQVKKYIDEVNKTQLPPATNIQYTKHEQTNKFFVKLINSETKEIIKEIPEEKVLDMIAKMWEFTGLFVDKKA